MTLIKTSWYLCIMLFLTFIVGSAITVVPSEQHKMNIILAVIVSLSVISGITAIILWRFYIVKPDSKLFTSKVIYRAYVSLAAFLTLLFVIGVMG